jgi:hypothetical protein
MAHVIVVTRCWLIGPMLVDPARELQMTILGNMLNPGQDMVLARPLLQINVVPSPLALA